MNLKSLALSICLSFFRPSKKERAEVRSGSSGAKGRNMVKGTDFKSAPAAHCSLLTAHCPPKVDTDGVVVPTSVGSERD